MEAFFEDHGELMARPVGKDRGKGSFERGEQGGGMGEGAVIMREPIDLRRDQFNKVNNRIGGKVEGKNEDNKTGFEEEVNGLAKGV